MVWIVFRMLKIGTIIVAFFLIISCILLLFKCERLGVFPNLSSKCYIIITVFQGCRIGGDLA